MENVGNTVGKTKKKVLKPLKFEDSKWWSVGGSNPYVKCTLVNVSER